MAESIVNVTEGSGKKLHTFNRTIGANSVEDDVSIVGEHYLATYSVTATSSVATANDHILQIMAGASLNLRIRSIRIRQGAVTTASTATIQVMRLTSAGTGGTAVTPAKYDTGDAAAGATAMTLPTVKGAESTILYTLLVGTVAAQPTSAQNEVLWTQQPGTKPIIIAAGTTNGIALKSVTAIAGVSMVINVELVETNFL